MKLWIIDDSNKTASCVLEPEEVEALVEEINASLQTEQTLGDYVSPLRNLALKLEKLGLQIEGL